ncbi:MAG TPA: hypothetical protein VHR45_19505 [Thermoanaerobaculia bacterium]|nr:hypothetical protein [Thermoanaerobaculia bacterium]
MGEMFNQVFRLPLAAFATWMGWLAQMARGMQQIAEQSSTALAAAGDAPAGGGAPAAPAAAHTGSSSGGIQGIPMDHGARAPGAATEAKKEKQIMADKDLSNDRVKLVEYSIVTIERGAERSLHDGEKLVSENMTGEDFATWVIAEFVQDHPQPHEIKRYLRVCYSVSCSWAREPLQFEEEQLKILRGIQHAIKECCEEGGRPFRRWEGDEAGGGAERGRESRAKPGGPGEPGGEAGGGAGRARGGAGAGRGGAGAAAGA